MSKASALSLAEHATAAVRRARLVLNDAAAFDPDRLDGRDPELIAHLLPLFEALSRRWMRLRVEGLAHIPEEPALFVGNHNGGILGPDLPCTFATLWRALGDAPLYALAHDFAMRRVAPLGRLAQAVGALRANPDTALRSLAAGGRLLVYPGGELDAYRHFRHRHNVVFGPRLGFVRLAQKARVPIVPVVAHGAHRSAVFVHEGEALARLFRLRTWSRIERFPIAFGLPWGIGLGPWVPYLPLPFPVRLRVLAPVEADPHANARDIRDRVVNRMQDALTEMATPARRSSSPLHEATP